MNWRDHIHSENSILGGKPVFVGTRYSVERVLKLMGAGWDYPRIAEEYPGVLPEHLRGAALLAADLVHDESFVAIGKGQAA